MIHAQSSSPKRPAKSQHDNTLLREQNEHLKSQLMNTSLINELTRVLHSCADLDGIIKTVLLAIQEIAEFDRAILFEIDRPAFQLKPRSWVGLDNSFQGDFPLSLGFDGGEVTDAMFLNRHIVVDKPDTKTDLFSSNLHSEGYVVIPLISRVAKRCWEAKSCTKTTCPAYNSYNPYCWSIIGGGQLTSAKNEDEKRNVCINCPSFKASGVFWIDRTTRKKPVTSDDITTVTAIVNLAGIIIENFRILRDLDTANTSLQRANTQLNIVNHDLQIAQSRIKTDLDHARSIQLGLLPQEIERTSPFPVAARYLSADAVGGDYYDIFETPNGLYGLVVADVSGHGIASALIMSMVKMLLKSFATVEPSPQKTLERINDAFLSDVKTNNFVTIFYALIDRTAHTIRYTSAGHCPMLFINRTTGHCDQIKADGLFMGVFPSMMLKETTFSYKPDELRIVLYTDGLIEAKAANDDSMYSLERLCETALATLTLAPGQSLDKILADQRRFCGPNAVAEDDVTMLILDL